MGKKGFCYQCCLPIYTLGFGVAEPCSRFREDGGALFERSEFALPPELANRAGNPKDHDRANMVLGLFAETKGPHAPGRNPDNFKKVFLYFPFLLQLISA
jgi:hypothetical protein